MLTSGFQFTQPRMVSLQYIENAAYCSNGDEIELPISILPKIQRTDDDPFAIVNLKIKVGDHENTYPFCISVEMCAQFRWEAGKISAEDIESLLNKNAVLLLISYARPIIATVTSQSRYPTFDLPYIDLTKQ